MVAALRECNDDIVSGICGTRLWSANIARAVVAYEDMIKVMLSLKLMFP